jgi:hypothetical protein
MATPKQLDGTIAIPLDVLLMMAESFRYSRSDNFERTPWECIVQLDRRCLEHNHPPFGDGLPEAMHAIRAIGRRMGI